MVSMEEITLGETRNRLATAQLCSGPGRPGGDRVQELPSGGFQVGYVVWLHCRVQASWSLAHTAVLHCTQAARGQSSLSLAIVQDTTWQCTLGIPQWEYLRTEALVSYVGWSHS